MRGLSFNHEVSKQVEGSRYFYLSSDKFESESLFCVFGGKEKCQNDYRIMRRNFPLHCLEFVVDGSGELEVDGNNLPLAAGSLFYFGPESEYLMSTHSEAPMTKYFIVFSGSGSVSHIRDIGLDQSPVFQGLQVSELSALYEAMLIEGSKEHEWVHSVCAHYLSLLFLKIRESIAEKMNRSEGSIQSYYKIRRVIEENFLELNTMEEIAKQAELDGSYVCRLFKRHSAISPYQFLMRSKMNFALELLRSQSLPVKQVAAQLGFDDPYHFSRVFKKVHGIAPKYFRS